MKYLLSLVSIISFFLQFQAQQVFKTQDEKQLKEWLKEAKRNNEANKRQFDRAWELVDTLQIEKYAKDPNVVYNYGRAIHQALQPSFQIPNHSFSKGAIMLMVEVEQAYRYSIQNCDCHGRANIMLGMLYNQQKKYSFSEPYLEKGLALKEGSDDWMIAANQYLLSGAYTNQSKSEKYQKIYFLFKDYAPKHSNPYYLKMARLYVPYYED